MALISRTYRLPKDGRILANEKKVDLLTRHRGAMDKVVAEAKTFSADHKRDLGKIVDKTLLKSAKR